jgi:hypothetical protein
MLQYYILETAVNRYLKEIINSMDSGWKTYGMVSVSANTGTMKPGSSEKN